ncbi:hypothetical protein [Psychrobacter sp. ASPA161_6]|uniref:hypothetical protein n=1 Tax=Psychrobacter sp. ASPA161_6 TaxID=3160962 RepID=UPI003F7E3055
MIDNLLFDFSKYEYAFFLYKDGFIDEKRGYSKYTEVLFDIGNRVGRFHVKCFVREIDSAEVQSCSSKKLAINLQPYNIDRWRTRIVKTSIDSFMNARNNLDGLHQLQLSNCSIDILFHNFDSLNLDKGILVCFSAAIGSRHLKQAPFFSGLKIAKKLDMPLVAIADPSLSLSNSLALSWYAGNESIKDLPKQLANILDMVVKKFDTKLTLFGGSGGGFAALNIAAEMSHVVNVAVWNPQTSISKYTKQEVIRYIESCYSSHTIESDLYKNLESIGVSHDLISIYRKLKKSDNILFLQNTGDTHHIEKHAKPLMKALEVENVDEYTFISGEVKTLTFWLKKWGKGHIAPSEDVILKVLSEMIANKSSKQIALQLH